jgi:hypothetical protein
VVFNGPISEIDSIMVQFTNDLCDEYGDRNLFVKGIEIDKQYYIPFLNNSVYDIGALDNRRRIINDLSSNAELVRRKMIGLGIDSNLIISTPGPGVRFNRTLTSALGFRDWLKDSEIEITGINVISLGTHARRTRLVYDKVLNGEYKIGIISLPDYQQGRSKIGQLRKTLRETMALIYYSIILIPY